MKYFVLCLFLGAVAAEAPFAGYAPSGWRPQGAQLKLPSEYGAPVVQEPVEVEITQENIAHAGQLVETTTDQYPSNEYLPPTTTDQPELDPIRVQGLPDNQFKDFQRSKPQQAARLSANRRTNLASKQPQVPQPQSFFALNGQLRVLPVNNLQFGRQEQAIRPVQTYGVPNQDGDDATGKDVPETYDQPEEPVPTEQPEPNDEDEEEDQSDPSQNDNRPVIAASNAFSGQYYIVGQDNKLQRVIYSTSQTEDDRRQMGFTAQLRYSPVEPIQGPVYAYNEQGQLVRIYK
ncbi:uncharacterized protein LOC131690053 [Topomyia yanbarensis]|uniref:uncharacterized protein LOC131690053 n=1 Tax=Topomyia yanbarensis TaxID=2498891 RepID=UPI00273CD6B1|nr:uncharacterized protein LOC131690053 [Topomyia yanbarensis]